MKCPKCHADGRAGSRICRQCGSILGKSRATSESASSGAAEPRSESAPGRPATGEPPRSADAADPAPGEASRNAAEGPPRVGWRCKKCGELHPRGYVVCWKCGTDSEGNEDPHFVGVEGGAPEAALTSAETPKEPIRRPGRVPACERCGSSRVVPNVPVVGAEQASDAPLPGVVSEDPAALFFKRPFGGELRAWICGDCGHVELRVRSSSELYRKYRETRDGRQSRSEPEGE